MIQEYLFIGGPLDGQFKPMEVRDGQPHPHNVRIPQIKKADFGLYAQASNHAQELPIDYCVYLSHRITNWRENCFVYAIANMLPDEVLLTLIRGYKKP